MKCLILIILILFLFCYIDCRIKQNNMYNLINNKEMFYQSVPAPYPQVDELKICVTDNDDYYTVVYNFLEFKFQKKCPNGNCSVTYNSSKREFYCGCTNSTYNIVGQLINSTSPSNLVYNNLLKM